MTVWDVSELLQRPLAAGVGGACANEGYRSVQMQGIGLCEGVHSLLPLPLTQVRNCKFNLSLDLNHQILPPAILFYETGSRVPYA